MHDCVVNRQLYFPASYLQIGPGMHDCVVNRQVCSLATYPLTGLGDTLAPILLWCEIHRVCVYYEVCMTVW